MACCVCCGCCNASEPEKAVVTGGAVVGVPVGTLPEDGKTQQ
eukprot:CAMPEP_0170589962 /NCGR_PEP_ID=MMETSP0224-20130122/11619_1 /TAXON_ID=285029 /ORGANISM="Togula jolla, Strain CCCM 725" /LENGTH=41 /DNA_ID= /DNA_START= /DNA_END= /DNA_ORIENTATION=